MPTFLDPKKIVAELYIRDGFSVADFGAGAGLYTLAAAERVGEDGHVYAIDIQQDLLRRIKNLAAQEGFENIDIVTGDLETAGGSTLADKSVDVVIIANILFQIDDKETVIAEANRVLKDKGNIAIIDWTDSFKGLGPQPEFIVTKEEAQDLCRQTGLVVKRDIDAGAHHYGFVCVKEGQ